MDRLTLEVVFITPFNILMLDPATSEVPPEEDMVVPTIVMFVPAVKVRWTFGAVKLVKVAFVPDTLRTFIFPVQLILLQLILVIVPRVALLLVELKLVKVAFVPDTLRTFIFPVQLILLQLILVIVPRVALLLVELKLVKVEFVPDRLVARKKGVMMLVSQFRAAISPSGAVIKSVRIAFDSMLSVTKAYIYPLDEFRLDRLTEAFVFTTPFNILIFSPAVSVAVEDMVVPTIVIPVPAVKVGWTLDAVIEVADRFVHDRLTILPFSELTLLMFKIDVVLIVSSTICRLFPATKICCVDMVRFTIAIPGPAIKVSCRLSAVR